MRLSERSNASCTDRFVVSTFSRAYSILPKCRQDTVGDFGNFVQSRREGVGCRDEDEPHDAMVRCPGGDALTGDDEHARIRTEPAHFTGNLDRSATADTEALP